MKTRPELYLIRVGWQLCWQKSKVGQKLGGESRVQGNYDGGRRKWPKAAGHLRLEWGSKAYSEKNEKGQE